MKKLFLIIGVFVISMLTAYAKNTVELDKKWVDKINAEIDYDYSESLNDPLTRFDRRLVEQFYTDETIKKYLTKIDILITECLSSINKYSKEKLDIEQIKSSPAPLAIGYFHIEDMYLKPNYLWPLVSYCSSQLYSKKDHISGLYLKDDKVSKFFINSYNLDSFEYVNYGHNRSSNELRKEAESFYELAYLYIKSAGLLRRMPGAYYPKSLLRKHADETGLTTFINDKQKGIRYPLRHDYLAIEFFKSYEAWMDSLNVFLDNEIVKLNIKDIENN